MRTDRTVCEGPRSEGLEGNSSSTPVPVISRIRAGVVVDSSTSSFERKRRLETFPFPDVVGGRLLCHSFTKYRYS